MLPAAHSCAPLALAALTVADEGEFATLQRTGGLKAVNQAHRRLREAAAAEGWRVARYQVYLEAEKLRMVRTIAACAVQADWAGFGALP
jgi:hypothetical protein